MFQFKFLEFHLVLILKYGIFIDMFCCHVLSFQLCNIFNIISNNNIMYVQQNFFSAFNYFNHTGNT